MDDNRVLKAFDELSPDERKAAVQRWGSEKAWYLCKYTTTIEVGIRDGFALDELATHYSIPVKAVKLCAENFHATKDVKNTPPKLQEVSFNNDLPPGAVQGPIEVPTALVTFSDSVTANYDTVQEDKTPKKRGRKKGSVLVNGKVVEGVEKVSIKEDKKVVEKPMVQEAAKVNPPNCLHPSAIIEGVVIGVDNSVKGTNSDRGSVLFHAKAQINDGKDNPIGKRKSVVVPKTYKTI
jgi:hypothetical protein